MEPEAGTLSPNYGVDSVPLAEYAVLMATDPAYLSADSEHIQADPPWKEAC
jgi:hypothetical protein